MQEDHVSVAGGSSSESLESAPTGPLPRISVLLPVFNAERTLGAALDSILDQTFRDFELLAFDDGSTDGSRAILEAYAARDPRIRALTGPNRGLVPTLNDLISRARAPYLARMDADDIALPERFAHQIAFLESHPDHVVVGTYVEMMDESALPIGLLRGSSEQTQHEAIDLANLRGLVAICHPSVMIKAAALRAVGGYDERFRNAEDVELWLRMAEKGKIANIPIVLLKYRLSEKGLSGAKIEEQRLFVKKACEEACMRRGVESEFLYKDWRPGSDRASRLASVFKYAAIARGNGHLATVRRFAWRALALAPFSPKSWRLAAIALLRRVPSGGAAQR